MHAALWHVIEALGTLHVYLDQTDHLSDRELYTKLLREVLPEEMDALDADEKTREYWRQDFREEAIPEHEDPPYDRDSRLPRAWWS